MPKIFLAGHRGMVGSAIQRRLEKDNLHVITRAREQLDLTNQKAVFDFFSKHEIDEVILAAAKVGGIHANNSFPADFIYENIQIQSNIIHSAHKTNVQKLLFLGSSCIYPKFAKQPISEQYLMSGALEETNEPYAIAKIAGIKMCESYNRQFGRDYRSVMPTNLYGPGDDYYSDNSHVVPALIRRIHEAKIGQKSQVVIWGSGNPRREFLYVDDMAEASLFLHRLDRKVYIKHISPNLSHVNIGFGKDISIRELGLKISNIIGFKGRLKFDLSKPDGTPQKLLDTSLMQKMGWKPRVSLETGLEKSYSFFKKESDFLLKK